MKINLEKYKEKLLEIGCKDTDKLHISHKTLDLDYCVGITKFAIKPNCLWYSVDFEWLDFTTYNGVDFYTEDILYTYKIDTSNLNMLILNNINDVIQFKNEYYLKDSYIIDWAEVMRKYDDISAK